MGKLVIRTSMLGLKQISAAEGISFQQVTVNRRRIRQTVPSEEIAKRKSCKKFRKKSNFHILAKVFV